MHSIILLHFSHEEIILFSTYPFRYNKCVQFTHVPHLTICHINNVAVQILLVVLGIKRYYRFYYSIGLLWFYFWEIISSYSKSTTFGDMVEFRYTYQCKIHIKTIEFSVKSTARRLNLVPNPLGDLNLVYNPL